MVLFLICFLIFSNLEISSDEIEKIKESLPNFIIFQFSGPIKKKWLEEIETIKIKRLNSAYLKPYSLIYWIENTEELEKLRKFDFIKSMKIYDGSYKTNIKFQEKKEKIKIRIRIIKEENIKKILNELNKIGLEILEFNSSKHYLSTPSIVAIAEKEKIFEIEKIKEVWWIEEIFEVKPTLSTAREIHQIGVGNGCDGNLSEVPLWSEGITGAGFYPSCGNSKGTEQIVGVLDTTFFSPDFDCDLGVPNCTIAKFVDYGANCDINETSNYCISGGSHGSATAGIIVGNGDQSDTDGDGDGEIPIEGCSNKGLSFGARLWGLKCDRNPWDFYCLNYCHSGDYTITLSNFFQASYEDGSRISSHSWGTPVMGQYDSSSEIVDIWAYDNDNNPSNALTQNYLWFFSSGNSGPGLSTIYSPGTAKNDLTCGAFYNGSDGICYPGDNPPCDENKLVIYSSRGPTLDGRYGPDLAGVSQYVTTPKNGTGYQEFGGTSAGTPALAALAALIRDWLERFFGINPSGNLIKAFLINSGEYLTYPNENLPGNGQGWGRANFKNLCDDFSNKNCNQLRSIFREGSFSSTGQSYIFDFYVLNTSKPLNCTLSWFDPPNLVGGGALVNDLNLRINSPNGTDYYLGNDFSGQWSNSNGTNYDDLNNVEGIRIQNLEFGLWKVEILSENIPMPPINWAVVCSGGIFENYNPPRPIPAGYGDTKALLAKKIDIDGNQLQINWDSQCNPKNANIIYGQLADLPSYSIIGSKCNISNPDTWNIGATTNIWFLLLTDEGQGVESSWGYSTSGERNGTNPSNQCSNTQRDNFGTCP
mgnify:CR=1 FL=1